MDFRDYKTASKYAAQINAGYSARLYGLPRIAVPEGYPPDKVEAFHHGWDKAKAWENLNASRQDGNHLLQDGWAA